MKLLLSAAAFVAVVAPVALGLMNSSQDQSAGAVPSYRFEVATIKPNNTGRSRGFMPGFTADGYRFDYVRLQTLIMQAYGIQSFQLSGGPAWLETETYNIEAKMDAATADALSKLPPDQLRLVRQQMLQSFLEERIGLKVHRETKEGSIYLLVVAKSGLKLRESKPVEGVGGTDAAANQSYAQLTQSGIIAHAYSALRIARFLSSEVRRPVVDKTGLTGIYDFTLDWARDLAAAPPSNEEGSDASADPGAVSLFTAIQQPLGLKLAPGKGPVEVIVIDHADKPSGN
jgi:uncharacterized protein (TIGR03435 family)